MKTCNQCGAETEQECAENDCGEFPVEDVDPTPWCSGCGAMTQDKCKCGPLADND